MAKLFSPAKINLGLGIVGRRSDGYHLLQSLFAAIDFGDEIFIEAAPKTTVGLEWAESALVTSDLPSVENNLVTRLLSEIPSQWKIQIKKQIPIGGGLGGGSSNVGTLLKYFVSLDLISKTDALGIAKKLGADVAFFLESQSCWVTGIGEHCSPVKAPLHGSVLLVLVPESCPTQTIFKNYRDLNQPFSSSRISPQSASETLDYLKIATNDLEDSVCAHSPKISGVLKLLRSSSNNFCGLSGSGSSCFLLSPYQEDCEENFKELSISLRKLGCRTVNTKILHVF